MEVQSRSPLELVVMLYDGALRFVDEAKDAAKKNDIRRRSQAVSRALAIVAELQNTLKVEEGGEVGRELDRLYGYVMTRLVDVTVKRDARALEEVQRLLQPLRDAWAQTAAGEPAPRR